MKFKCFFFLCGILFCLNVKDVSASSLDELYRDIIRSDNRGYLPLFVKNRKAPVVLIEDSELSEVEPQGVVLNKGDDIELKLSKTWGQKSALAKARQLQWLKTIAAVKSNQVTPFELGDITTRVKENDPKAIEVLAWMYTKGIGVSKDFVEAFNLYKKAALLNVANADKNALLVYKSMNDEQRKQVSNRR